MAIRLFNALKPINGDSTHHFETRTNFQALAHHQGTYLPLAVTGANAAATDLDPGLYSQFNLTTDSAGGANDFDLMAPHIVGQTITITLAVKDTQNATITEDTSVVILQSNGSGVASVTLDAADEFIVLRAVSATTWVIVATSGTIA